MRDEVGPYVNECRQFIAELAARLRVAHGPYEPPALAAEKQRG